ncbi:MAG: hypothetical protein J3K34DRAFT_527346 [Monoraphidium minutum]|nr:MAG: hypothetical protein J3K34DRAFT_527346 [Monoraphidium minutum]
MGAAAVQAASTAGAKADGINVDALKNTKDPAALNEAQNSLAALASAGAAVPDDAASKQELQAKIDTKGAELLAATGGALDVNDPQAAEAAAFSAGSMVGVMTEVPEAAQAAAVNICQNLMAASAKADKRVGNNVASAAMTLCKRGTRHPGPGAEVDGRRSSLLEAPTADQQAARDAALAYMRDTLRPLDFLAMMYAGHVSPADPYLPLGQDGSFISVFTQPARDLPANNITVGATTPDGAAAAPGAAVQLSFTGELAAPCSVVDEATGEQQLADKCDEGMLTTKAHYYKDASIFTAPRIDSGLPLLEPPAGADPGLEEPTVVSGAAILSMMTQPQYTQDWTMHLADPFLYMNGAQAGALPAASPLPCAAAGGCRAELHTPLDKDAVAAALARQAVLDAAAGAPQRRLLAASELLADQFMCLLVTDDTNVEANADCCTLVAVDAAGDAPSVTAEVSCSGTYIVSARPVTRAAPPPGDASPSLSPSPSPGSGQSPEVSPSPAPSPSPELSPAPAAAPYLAAATAAYGFTMRLDGVDYDALMADAPRRTAFLVAPKDQIAAAASAAAGAALDALHVEVVTLSKGSVGADYTLHLPACWSGFQINDVAEALTDSAGAALTSDFAAAYGVTGVSGTLGAATTLPPRPSAAAAASGLSPGAQAGIVFAVIIPVAAGVAAGLVLWRHRLARQRAAGLHSTYGIGAGEAEVSIETV